MTFQIFDSSTALDIVEGDHFKVSPSGKIHTADRVDETDGGHVRIETDAGKIMMLHGARPIWIGGGGEADFDDLPLSGSTRAILGLDK